MCIGVRVSASARVEACVRGGACSAQAGGRKGAEEESFNHCQNDPKEARAYPVGGRDAVAESRVCLVSY